MKIEREASELGWPPGEWPVLFELDVPNTSGVSHPIQFVRQDPILIEQQYESPELGGYKYWSIDNDIHLTVYND